MILIMIGVGVIVGIMGAVLGIGGGIIMVPILVIALKVPVHEAIAVSLAVITANSLSTSSVYIKNGLANMHFGMLLGTAAVLGALLGSYISVSLSQKAVMLILGCMQMVIAYLTYIKTKHTKQYIPVTDDSFQFFDGRYTEKSSGEVIHYRPVRVWYNSLFGYFSGIFAGLTGAGGGILIIPGMNLISHMPIKAATATSTFIIGFTAATGAIVYMMSGYLRPEMVCAMFIGVTAGTAISMKLFSKVTDKKVSYLFIALLLCVSVQMIWRGLKG